MDADDAIPGAAIRLDGLLGDGQFCGDFGARRSMNNCMPSVALGPAKIAMQ
jgi:hypothetical protein